MFSLGFFFWRNRKRIENEVFLFHDQELTDTEIIFLRNFYSDFLSLYRELGAVLKRRHALGGSWSRQRKKLYYFVRDKEETKTRKMSGEQQKWKNLVFLS